MESQMTQLTCASSGAVGESGAAGGGSNATTYTISGVKVEFPAKAYPSQIAMMNKVIQGLKQNKNCLLESPTGSGKTLALLCASLAWQRHEYARVAAINAEIEARQEEAALLAAQERRQAQQRNQGGGESGKDALKVEDVKVEESSPYFPTQAGGGGGSAPPIYELTDDSDDDFKPTSKRPKSIYNPIASSKAEEVSTKPPPPPESPKLDEHKPYFVPPEKKLTVPKIFFCTRTHKQIAQITRELRKTFYKSVRSAILASREHTCINPMLNGVPNKNEQCREMLDNSALSGDGCSYHNGARKFGNFNYLENYGVYPGYDLEDFVKAGRVAKACPYYATRFLMANADIIFCPYNYLIDPSIRNSMNINFENQVVIFDEAHNMEDASREAGSFILKHHEMTKAMQDCEKVKSIGGAEPHALAEIASMLSTFCTWIDDQSKNLQDISYNTSGKYWNGTEIIAALQFSGLDERSVKSTKACFTAVLDQRERDLETAKERGVRARLEKPSISVISISIIENVFRLFEDMYKNNGCNRDDFRIALIKSMEKRRRDGQSGPFMTFVTLSLNVWCLNPALAFGEIRDVVHSIVLTSGTLSPMHSFESELGTPFPFKLEASHVIDKNQVWAGVVGTGPSGVNLNGSYQSAQSLCYQDEVGNVVQYVCDTMPHGVLCFFPSYQMMGKMVDRWRLTMRYRQLEEKKLIVIEPRSGPGDFEVAMNEFYASIKRSESEEDDGGVTGALFLAVCRGKVSEGLDFSDNNARAVICIGIPFPNFHDMQVKLKRDYNQANVSRGLLPGGEWYDIQAFRALNQALGRCIRHRQDWGAILLVDDRYIKNPRYIQSLSRWIRSSVQNFTTFFPLKNNMECFRDEMLARPIPTESTFAPPSPYGTFTLSLMNVGIGGGDENASSSYLLPNNAPRYPDGRLHIEPSSYSVDESSTDSTDFIPKRGTKAGNSNKSNRSFNPPVSQGRKSGISQTQLQNVTAGKSPGIAALFAKQFESSRVHNSSNRNDSSGGGGDDDELPDTRYSSSQDTQGGRNKRGRDKKIKL
ncbi:Fanconi anemia group J protein homolog [Folsomia candida]|uniref:Fanconi anemia group J protein homolog n=1 Tax=Folsomia candida TaxID=158441 RepID=UPI000B8FC826|nr:Fanconi anemia group J protein homolog [Folsomia candida]